MEDLKVVEFGSTISLPVLFFKTNLMASWVSRNPDPGTVSFLLFSSHTTIELPTASKPNTKASLEGNVAAAAADVLVVAVVVTAFVDKSSAIVK